VCGRHNNKGMQLRWRRYRMGVLIPRIPATAAQRGRHCEACCDMSVTGARSFLSFIEGCRQRQVGSQPQRTCGGSCISQCSSSVWLTWLPETALRRPRTHTASQPAPPNTRHRAARHQLPDSPQARRHQPRCCLPAPPARHRQRAQRNPGSRPTACAYVCLLGSTCAASSL
jgi:hypothetical protein